MKFAASANKTRSLFNLLVRAESVGAQDALSSSRLRPPAALLLFSILLGATASCGKTTETTSPDAAVTALASRKADTQDLPVRDILYRVHYRFNSDASYDRTVTRKYEILTSDGVKNWTEVGAYYTPWRMDRPKLTARVTNGGEVTTLDQGTIVEEPTTPQAPDIYSDSRILRAPLPRIQIGSVIDFVLEETHIKPTVGNATSLSHVLQNQLKRDQVEVIIDLPESGLGFDHRVLGLDIKPTEKRENGRRILTFAASNLAPLKAPEGALAYDRRPWPSLAFSVGGSWKDVAADYAKIAQPIIDGAKVDPDFQPNLTRRASDLQKAQAVLDWVHERVRYAGIELGASAIVPHNPAEVLARGYGDCKDQATLVVSMLKSLGVDAKLVLLRAGYEEDVIADLPGANAFDHAIVVIPGKTPLWIDPTSEFSRAGELPLADQGRLALIIDEKTTSLTTTPVMDSSANMIEEVRRIDLSSHGAANVTETTVARGVLEANIRRNYDATATALDESFTRYVKDVYFAEKVKEHQLTAVRDLSQPFRMVIKADAAEIATTNLQDATVSIDNYNLLSVLPTELFGEDERHDDLYIRSGYRYAITYEIHPPRGFDAVKLPSFPTNQLGPYALKRSAKKDDNGVVRVGLEFIADKVRLSPDDVAAFRADLKKLEAEEKLTIQFAEQGSALIKQGEVAKGLSLLRKQIDADPKDAYARTRYAGALYDLGFGAEARQHIELALDKVQEDAMIHRLAGLMYTSNGVAQPTLPGWDRKKALIHFQRAKELEPDALYAAVEYAVLHEYDDAGVQYGSSAQLETAVELFNEIGDDKLSSYDEGGYLYNALYDLFFLKNITELKRRLADAKYAKAADSLRLAAASFDGNRSALLSELERLGLQGEQRDAALINAADLFRRVRNYDQSRAVLELVGDTPKYRELTENKRIALKNTKAVDVHKLSESSPDNVVKKMFGLVALGFSDDAPELQNLISSHARDSNGNGASLDWLRKRIAGNDGEQSNEAYADLMLGMYTFHQLGDDKNGYVVSIEVQSDYTDRPLHVAVVREGKKYRYRGTFANPIGLVSEAISALDKGDKARAEIWRDRFQNYWGGPMPLLAIHKIPFFAFSRSTTVPLEVQLATISIHSSVETVRKRAAQTLNSYLEQTDNPMVKMQIERSFGGAMLVFDPKKAMPYLERMLAYYPDDSTILDIYLDAAEKTGRVGEVRKHLQAAVAKAPRDIAASSELRKFEMRHGDLKAARALGDRAVRDGIADADTKNDLAWLSLFLQDVRKQDLDYALEAVLADHSPSYRHTLACVYLELGKVEDAQRIWNDFVEAQTSKKPLLDTDWYIQGRIAEAYGLTWTAHEAYQKVKKPTHSDGTQTYLLAQRRLKRLKVPRVPSQIQKPTLQASNAATQ